LIIVVDASSPDRIGKFEEFLRKGVTSIVIDHHATNTYFANECWVDASYSSAAQMILDLLKLMDVEYDSDLALMNYLGIATDTGFFRYSNVDSSVFEAAAELVKLGADPAFVATTILETRKIEELFLERDAIDNIKLISENRFAYSYLTMKDFERHSLTEDDFTGFVGELRSIESVEVALFASEAGNGQAHVSMRSKRYFDVSEIAVAFGGGGHQKASGFTLNYEGDLKEALAEVVEMIDSRLRNETD
jgi:phosphoesterase RecJ-like protein